MLLTVCICVCPVLQSDFSLARDTKARKQLTYIYFLAKIVTQLAFSIHQKPIPSLFHRKNLVTSSSVVIVQQSSHLSNNSYEELSLNSCQPTEVCVYSWHTSLLTYIVLEVSSSLVHVPGNSSFYCYDCCTFSVQHHDYQ